MDSLLNMFFCSSCTCHAVKLFSHIHAPGTTDLLPVLQEPCCSDINLPHLVKIFCMPAIDARLLFSRRCIGALGTPYGSMGTQSTLRLALITPSCYAWSSSCMPTASKMELFVPLLAVHRLLGLPASSSDLNRNSKSNVRLSGGF